MSRLSLPQLPIQYIALSHNSLLCQNTFVACRSQSTGLRKGMLSHHWQASFSGSGRPWLSQKRHYSQLLTVCCFCWSSVATLWQAQFFNFCRDSCQYASMVDNCFKSVSLNLKHGRWCLQLSRGTVWSFQMKCLGKALEMRHWPRPCSFADSLIARCSEGDVMVLHRRQGWSKNRSRHTYR